MKKMLFFLLLLQVQVSAQSTIQNIDFIAQDLSINDALQKLSEQTGVNIAFSKNFFKNATPVKQNFQNTSLADILDALLVGTAIEYKVLDGRILLFKKKQEIYTISGYIEDAASGEQLISATVYCPSLAKGTVTNEYGFYSLSLPKGKVDLVFSYLGYTRQLKHIVLDKSIRQDIHLHHSLTLAKVIVLPDSLEQDPHNAAQKHDFYPMHKKLLKFSPDFGGAADPIRTAQLLPGIQTGADGLDGIFVRGGNSGHNLMLLDGVPVYIPYHLLGFFSIYNHQTVRSAKVYKGSFPARYGGRLSSVFDVRTREGNQYNWKAVSSINLLSADALIEGPIQKGKGAVILAGRVSHSNFLLNPFFQRAYFDKESTELRTMFFDFNAKLNYTFSPKDRIYLSHYQGRDNMENSGESASAFLEEQEVELRWANSVTALRWNHLFHDKLFSNLTLTHSRFGYEYTALGLEREEEEEIPNDWFLLDFFSDNNDIGLQVDFDYLPTSSYRLRFGAGASEREFIPELLAFEEGDIELEELENINIQEFEQFRTGNVFSATEGNFYLENQLYFTKWQFNIGLRATAFLTETRNYAYLEPRIVANYRANDRLSFRAAGSRMIQYLHLVSYSNIRMPNDLWIPSDENLLPEEAWQGELGFTLQAAENTNIVVDAYYKNLKNLYTYPEDFDFGEDDDFQNYLLHGSGETKGIEFSLQHNQEQQGGLFSYTITNFLRQFDGLNEGKVFPHSHNHPHQIKLFWYQRLSSGLHLGINWVYHSAGLPLNITPLGSLQDDLEETRISFDDDFFDIPDYHRLDISATYNWKSSRLQHQLKIGGSNLYNRKNIAYFRLDFNEQESAIYSPVEGLPFRPALSYRLRF